MPESELNLLIARNISEYMNIKGLSQKDVADYVGVSAAAVSNWCNGVKIPRMDKIDRLCKLFGCTRTDLLEEKPLPSEEARIEAMLQEMKDNPQLGVLLSSTKDLNEQDLQMIIDMVKRLRESYKE